MAATAALKLEFFLVSKCNRDMIGLLTEQTPTFYPHRTTSNICMKRHLIGCVTCAAFVSLGLRVEAAVNAPYTDFDNVTADATVFNVAQRNSGTITTSVVEPTAGSAVGAYYQTQDSQSNGSGNNLGASLLTATNLSAGAKSSFTESSAFTVTSTGVNFQIGLAGLSNSTNAFGNQVITPTAFVQTNGTLGFYNYLFNQGSVAGSGSYSYNPIVTPDVVTVSKTNFANAIVNGSMFSMTLTGSFSPDGTLLTLGFNVKDVSNINTDPNVGTTASEVVTMNASDLTSGANAFGLYYTNASYPSMPALVTNFSNYSLAIGLPVPEPTAAWLLGVALLGVPGVMKMRRSAAARCRV